MTSVSLLGAVYFPTGVLSCFLTLEITDMCPVRKRPISVFGRRGLLLTDSFFNTASVHLLINMSRVLLMCHILSWILGLQGEQDKTSSLSVGLTFIENDWDCIVIESHWGFLTRVHMYAMCASPGWVQILLCGKDKQREASNRSERPQGPTLVPRGGRCASSLCMGYVPSSLPCAGRISQGKLEDKGWRPDICYGDLWKSWKVTNIHSG